MKSKRSRTVDFKTWEPHKRQWGKNCIHFMLRLVYRASIFALYVLTKSRQVASDILIGVKKELTADFRIIKTMGTDSGKSEVVHLDVWKCEAHFKILAIYSLPSNSP
ncbi:hypothetical protein CDAR_308421 [Caerostris darwini]|uniref:Transposase n=1 Tax=Caerostris darwini TaxID=1538125 RepID=A0AAV4TRF7_9ARAC|nr:hypothetical protein CDAR_308421 [Caerostris darwini]